MTTTTPSDPRPPSPWRGSVHRTRHRWQLDRATGLPAAADALHGLAAELGAAHSAGWWLVEPMRSGHLLAARPSRRRRAEPEPSRPPAPRAPAPPVHRRRLRVVDEPPLAGEEVLDAAVAGATPLLAWTGGALEHVGGPAVPGDVVAEATRQLAPAGLAPGRWGVATGVGPGVDLVAEGSALRLHTVRDGVLVRTREVLTFQHAADGAVTLLQAATAYERLARTVEALAAAGARLEDADDGFLSVSLGRPVR